MLFLKSSPSKLVSVTSGENRFLRLNNCVEYATGYHGCVRAAVCSWRWGSNHIDMLGSISPKWILIVVILPKRGILMMDYRAESFFII